MTEKTCEGCGAKCCKYVVLEIDTPEDLNDFENIKWYVCHKNTNVFVEEDGVWNVEFITTCEHLNEKDLCSVYEKRPQICREFTTDSCPHYNDYKELFRFEKLEEVQDYIDKIFNKGLHVIPEEEEEEDEEEN